MALSEIPEACMELDKRFSSNRHCSVGISATILRHHKDGMSSYFAAGIRPHFGCLLHGDAIAARRSLGTGDILEGQGLLILGGI